MKNDFKKILNLEYSGINGAYWMFYCVASSFASAFLLSKGYSNRDIGLILAVGCILAVLLQPLMADFADRSKKWSLIDVTQCCTVFMMGMELLLFLFHEKSLALTACFVLIVGWLTAFQPLLNSLCFKLEETGFHVNFGICRCVGSFAYAVLCAILGTLVEQRGAQILPSIGLFILLVLFLVLAMAKKHFYQAKKDGEPKSFSDETVSQNAVENDINLWEFIRGNQLFVAMNLGIIAVYYSNSILNSFMLQVVNGVGGDSQDMGRVFALMAFLEIPTLFLFDKIKGRFSCQLLLKVAAICFTIKIGLIFLAKSMTLIYLAHLFQLTSFALFLPAMVAFINQTMRKGEAVKGQALFTVMTTVSTVIASILGGIMLDTVGDKWMLLISTIVTLAGALVIVFLVDHIKKIEE